MSVTYRDSRWDRNGVISGMLDRVPLPRMARVRQRFDTSCVEDIPAMIAEQFSRREISRTIVPGATIAITVGSRGIANIPIIVREIVSNVKRSGGKPFIVPAMGSHGGATAPGQREVIEGLGVTEAFVGAPIRATMETVPLGYLADGKEVQIDRLAAAADGIIVAGRIKPHTAFRGDFESGLYKMLAIGLGKQRGAEVCHNEGFGRMAHNVRQFGEHILRHAPVLFGIGIVENAYDETALIEAIPTDRIAQREPELLAQARKLMPRILIEEIDILIVDQIGKNFSGDGMDPNITATWITPYATGGPSVQRYVVLDLSEETHGNMLGAGMAHFTTKRLFDKIDFDASYPNALTCTVVLGARVPMVLKNDATAIRAALFTCTGIDKERARVVRIHNTAHIDTLWVSEALEKEVTAHPDMEPISAFQDITFDAEGNLALR